MRGLHASKQHRTHAGVTLGTCTCGPVGIAQLDKYGLCRLRCVCLCTCGSVCQRGAAGCLCCPPVGPALARSCTFGTCTYTDAPRYWVRARAHAYAHQYCALSRTFFDTVIFLCSCTTDRPERCRTDEHCSPPVSGAMRGYCFNAAGKMENAEPGDPDYGVCYCGVKAMMRHTADGTTYCTSRTEVGEHPCRDSAGNPVAGSRLSPASAPPYHEIRTGAHEPRVCVFVGTAFEDSDTKTVVRGGQPVSAWVSCRCVHHH